ncbi:MAG TPA: hypothetical protein PKM41_01880 [Deltaproteobacteria bacterium]|jgi:hypothetical protein|nr:hypothetical protein [Deltaproteobacteria bacterium]HOI05718.1 hypothetical protein [Deltaproteobacteria bacterium]
MRTYITCSRRKGTPKVALDVCRACRYRLKCITFRKYANPQLFPD